MRNLSLGRTLTKEVKRFKGENRKGENNPFLSKKHKPETLERFKEIAFNRELLPVPGVEVEITDLETKITTVCIYFNTKSSSFY